MHLSLSTLLSTTLCSCAAVVVVYGLLHGTDMHANYCMLDKAIMRTISSTYMRQSRRPLGSWDYLMFVASYVRVVYI